MADPEDEDTETLMDRCQAAQLKKNFTMYKQQQIKDFFRDCVEYKVHSANYLENLHQVLRGRFSAPVPLLLDLRNRIERIYICIFLLQDLDHYANKSYQVHACLKEGLFRTPLGGESHPIVLPKFHEIHV